MMYGNIRKCGRKPKWLELEPGEEYVKSLLTKQGLFIVMMVGVVLLSVIFLVALIFGDFDKIIMPMGVMLGSFSSIGPLLGNSKLHMTSQRLVLELKHKYAGEIRLDQINPTCRSHRIRFPSGDTERGSRSESSPSIRTTISRSARPRMSCVSRGTMSCIQSSTTK